jgi:hypothetical protein
LAEVGPAPPAFPPPFPPNAPGADTLVVSPSEHAARETTNQNVSS